MFSSEREYLTSFINPLIEETRADLLLSFTTLSDATSSLVESVERSNKYKPPKDLLYEIELQKGIVENDTDAKLYEPQVGDIISITSVRPKCITDLDWPESMLKIVPSVTMINNALLDCHHQNTVKMIWGPPGTGKTKTVGFLLHLILRMECRTLTCAPTNTAIVQATKQLVKKVKESSEFRKYGLGDIVLFGNIKRMKIDDYDDLCNVFLDHRVDMLQECLNKKSGWEGSLQTMIALLKEPEKEYGLYLESIKGKDIQKFDNNDNVEKYDPKLEKEYYDGDRILKDKNSKKRWRRFVFEALKENNNKNKPTNHMLPLQKEEKSTQEENDGKQAEEKVPSTPLTFGEFVKKTFDCVKEQLYFCTVNLHTHLPTSVISLEDVKNKFAAVDSLKSLRPLLHDVPNDDLKEACGYAKLHIINVPPLELLTIDEAAQLKECESAIPLQLPRVRHAIVVGDERQLPAMVRSQISQEAYFGRSLFERLSFLEHKKYLLNVQKIYNSYSVIDVSLGKEQFDDRRSRKNTVEVAVVSEIIASLHKEYTLTRRKVRVGVISPYKAQVHAIAEKIREYTSHVQSDFFVSVRTVDGFQGGEEDVIIISTVRCNAIGSVSFLSSRQRGNMALAQARYCLWIVGSGATLNNSGTFWKNLVADAKERGCFHNALEDKSLAHAITLFALVELNQVSTLINVHSLLFRYSRWKVCLTDAVWRSVARLKSNTFCKRVLNLLEKLSNGWHQPHTRGNRVVHGGISTQLEQYYMVNTQLYFVWTVHILKENSHYIKVLNVWDILPQSDVPELSNRLDILYGSYSADKTNRCMYKCYDGSCPPPNVISFMNLVIPTTRCSVESSCAEANPAQLSKFVASFSTNDEREMSSTTNMSLIVPRCAEDDPIELLCKAFALLSLQDRITEIPIDSSHGEANTSNILSRLMDSLGPRNEPETSNNKEWWMGFKFVEEEINMFHAAR
ncbi:hypothetical protein TIFTF001_031630 [Ficus carica]|uniref:P-loop containing nucleoside triphosphate hydrolase n=1 Tax=Ficus carica TaxID=3494 RepID=A0AA88DVA8_FICCA|nr:hypothetical protein TIFTF001_031630 [Ficus carica]